MKKIFFLFVVFLISIEPFAFSVENYSNALHILKIGYLKDGALMLKKLSMDSSYPLNDYAAYKLAQLYQEKGLLKNAEEEYLNVVNSTKDSILVGKALIKIAEIKLMQNDIKDAAYYFDEAIKKSLVDAQKEYSRYKAGICYEKLGDIDLARETYSQLIICHPFSENVIKAKRRLKLLGLKQREPTSAEIFERAEKFFENGDYSSAAVNYKMILDKYKNSQFATKSLLKLGICYYKSGFSSSAAKLFDSAKIIFPEALYYQGQALLQGGNIKEAILQFSRVSEFFPDSEFAAEVQLKIADYYNKSGYEDVAEKLYSSIIQNYPKSSAAIDTYWRKGFSKYKKESFDEAYNIFSQASEVMKSSKKTASCLFWQAKCAQKMGMKEVANQLFEKVAKEYPNSYYGFRSAQILNMDLPPLGRGNFYVANFEYNLSDNIHWIKFCELFNARLYDLAFEEVQYYYSICKTPQEKEKARAALATVLASMNEYQKAIRFVERNFEFDNMSKEDIDINRENQLAILYPRWYSEFIEKYASKFGVEPSLVYAIIREESRFNTYALSRAMACGLTQIMPSTGKALAKKMGIKNYSTSKLFDPELNIRMGTYYISQLLKKYNGNKHLALAAYNGGSGRVRKWKRENGLEDIDEFVEDIPFRETRGYVKKVLESYWQYKRLYETQKNVFEEKEKCQKKTG